MNVVKPDQVSNTTWQRSALEAHTILHSGILLAGGDGGACASRIWLKDMDYLRSSSSIPEGMCSYSIEREAFLCSAFLCSLFF